MGPAHAFEKQGDSYNNSVYDLSVQSRLVPKVGLDVLKERMFWSFNISTCFGPGDSGETLPPPSGKPKVGVVHF